MKKLTNRTVFITGGLSGIGKACAIAAAREGANIAIGDPEEVAAGFIFLDSDESSYMIGSTLEIDRDYLSQ